MRSWWRLFLAGGAPRTKARAAEIALALRAWRSARAGIRSGLDSQHRASADRRTLIRDLQGAVRPTATEVDAFETPTNSRVARYYASLLRRLGYRSSLRLFRDWDGYVAYVADSRNRAQIGQAGWAADTLGASNFLRPLFTCTSFMARSPANLNLFEYCDKRLDAKMRTATALEGSDPGRADELWAQVDRALVDRAVTIPWSTPRYRVLVSERVGDVQSHLLWGTLLEQLWVK